ncbi:MAG TPA: hypothetical protein GYA06_07185 [Chloroflexi bacterium]|nr:hypothetical protein [Chloroflexota bacterium]HPO58155.1 hypothetical protein [Anaerolineaceae bacterium]
MYMVFCVIDDVERLDDVLDAWVEAGITGTTILESTGIARKRKRYIPMRFNYGVADRMEGHYTLITIVPDEDTVRRCLKAAESVIGDLNEPNTGVFAAWPLSVTKGAGRKEGMGED